MPGLYDMHVHTYFAGRDKLSCRFAQGADAKAIVAAVKACAAKAKPGEWITGGSWVGAAFKPGEQNKRLLDAVAPNNPVMLNDESLHSVWVNSKVLAIAGITRATKDTPGGVIDRDAKGEPTGVLREVTARDIERFMSKFSVGKFDINKNPGKNEVQIKSSMMSATLKCGEGTISVDGSLSLMALPFKSKIDEGIDHWVNKMFNPSSKT